jgi:heat-inducible transcriptional repressor
MQKYRMSQNELVRMNALVKSRLAEVDRLLETATQLAAALTNYTSLAVKPRQSRAVIDRFKTVLLGDSLFMLIMMDGGGNIKTREIHTDFPVDADLVSRLEFALNTYVAGRRLEEITVPLVMTMERSFGEGESLIGRVIKDVCETMSEMDGGDLKISGVNRLLEYPEYADAREFKELLGVLEEKRDILRLVSDTAASEEGAQVIIGSENGMEEMKNSTLVFQKIKVGGKVIGAIGILGPRRMDYSKVVSTVEYIAENISELLNTTPQLSDGSGNHGKDDEP